MKNWLKIFTILAASVALSFASVGCGDSGGGGGTSTGADASSTGGTGGGGGGSADAGGTGGGGGADAGSTAGSDSGSTGEMDGGSTTENDTGSTTENDGGSTTENDGGSTTENDGGSTETDVGGGQPGDCPRDSGDCALPSTFGPGFKIHALSVPTDNSAGNALDVDGDGKLDNALGALLAQFGAALPQDPNALIQENLDNGKVMILGEAVGDWADSATFTIDMFLGALADDNADCDFQDTATVCNYLADARSWDCNCNLLIAFDNAVVDSSGVLTAGGMGYVFALSLPIAGAELQLSAINAQVIGDWSVDADGAIHIDNGLIGGAIPKDSILEALSQNPDTAQYAQLLDQFLTPDIDTDGDGTPDSVSVAIKFAAHGANITGVLMSTDTTMP